MRHCYCEPTDKVLRKWELSLRNLYTVYALGDGGIAPADSLISNKLLDFKEWKKLLLQLDLLDDNSFTQKHATLVFLWSGMAVVNEGQRKSRIRLIHLNFEDFCEALVRMATMKALPFDEEISGAGCADAGEFLLELKQHPALYKAFLADHRQEWHKEPRQPADRCLEHLVSYIVRLVDTGTKGAVDGAISMDEARQFHRGFGAALKDGPKEGDKDEDAVYDHNVNEDEAAEAAVGTSPPASPRRVSMEEVARD